MVLLDLSIVVDNGHLSIAVLVLGNVLGNRPIESISFVEVITEYLLLLLSQIRFLRNPKKTVPLIDPIESKVLNIISSTEINDDYYYYYYYYHHHHYHFVLLVITP